MLTNIRRAVNSSVGKIVALGVVVVVGIAFAAGDITNLRGDGAAIGGGAVAEVDGVTIGEADLRQRVQTAYGAFQQQQPGLDLASFVNQGGLQTTLERTINGLAMERFALDNGMAASRRAVDGEIASIPAFRGLDGQFSQSAYDAILRQQGLTDAALRADIARDMLARQLLAPTLGTSQVPAQLALPYASLLLERRRGSVAYIPVGAFASDAAAVPEAELTAFYTRNRARYTVPERRVIRYALGDATTIAAAARATPAEVAAAYAQNRARFAPRETRTIESVVVADAALAARIAASVRGGTAIAAAARTAGLEPSTATGVDRAAFAGGSAPAVADAAFAAAEGAVVGPVRSPLGFHILRVTDVTTIPGRSLAEATPTLEAEIARQKGAAAVADLSARLDSAAADNATFDEIVADGRLTAGTTPAITAAGIDPLGTETQASPLMVQLAATAFAAADDDPPSVVQTAPDGSFAVVSVGQVVPAAPRPLAQIRDRVAQDFVTDRNLRQARGIAANVMNRVNGGTPLATALGAANLRLPPVQAIDASRAELARTGQALPPPVALMFSMPARRARILEAPNRGGWYVVYLDAIQGGNAAGNTALVNQTRAGIGGVVGGEYAEQFARAVRDSMGVRRDDAALARVRESLVGGSAQ